MQIDLQARRRRHPSMTSLIDVIFLLLLFFMLSSTFSKYSELEISGANPGSGISNEKPQLFINLSRNGWIINGQTETSSSLQQRLAALSQSGKTMAVLQVADGLTSQEMINAIELLQQEKITVQVITQ